MKRLIFIPLLVILSGCQQLRSQIQRPKPLPQDPLVEVYFNHSESSEYKEPYRQQIRLGDDLEQQIVATISQAKSTVDIAVQELRLPKVSHALADKHKAGVKVRVILENNYSRPWSSLTQTEVAKLEKREQERYNEFQQFVDLNQDNKLSPEEINQKDALVILRNARIPWLDDTADGSKGSSLMHHKFIVVDHRFVIVTSANMTQSDTHGDFTNSGSLGNANNLLKIDSPEIASLFTQEFNLMWGDGMGAKTDSKFGIKKPLRNPQTINLGNSTITVQFSPTSPTEVWSRTSNGLIGKTLNAATKSVDMALFVFSEQRLADILEDKNRDGSKIRTLIEPDFAYRYYSEGLDMMGVALSNKCKYEIDNRSWTNPITTVGVPLLPQGDLLHHKFGIIDNQAVITGSHNWSEVANSGNDETLIIVNNPTVAAHYVREFERLYKNAKVGVPPEIQQKITAQKQQCPRIETPSSTDNIISQKVNLNTASLAELEALPGVGKKLAQRIIIARQQKRFTSLASLEQIPGFSSRLLQKLDGQVTW